MLAHVSATTGRGRLSRTLTNGLLAGVGAQARWIIAGLLLAVSALFGGLEAVPVEQGPAAAVGTPVEGGPWRVEVLEVRLADDLPPLRRQKDTNRWVYVIANVTITADESWTLTKQMIRLSGVDGVLTEEPYDMTLDRDKRVIRRLHPNMPEKVAFFWEQSGDAAPPTTATVLVLGRVYREDSLSGEWQWKDDGDVSGRITLPVRDLRASLAATPSPSGTPAPGAAPSASPGAGPSRSATPSRSPRPTPSVRPSA